MDDIDISEASTSVAEGLGIELSSTADKPDTPEDSGQGQDQGTDQSEGTSASTDKPAAPGNDQVQSKADTANKPAPAPGQPTPPPGPNDPMKAPNTWKEGAKAEWDKLPPSVQQEIWRREEDVLRGIGQYKQAAAYGQAFHQATQQFEPLFREHGINPAQLTNQLMSTYQTLALGTPDQKLQTLQTLARQFNVQLAPATAPEDSPYVDPEVVALRAQMTQLQSAHQALVQQQTAEIQRRHNEIRSNLATELNTFAADPENVFFDSVANDMAILIQSGRASSLKQAYDLAIRMTPEVWEKEQLRLQAKQQQAQGKEIQAAAARTAAARTATGANVRSSGGGRSSGASSSKSMDFDMSAAYDQIVSRS